MRYLLLKAVIFSILTFAVAPKFAAASDKCFGKNSTLNICDFARNVQKEMAPNLPMQISKNLLVRNIIAVGPTIQVTAMLKYDESHLNSALKAQGTPRSTVDDRMFQMTKNMQLDMQI